MNKLLLNKTLTSVAFLALPIFVGWTDMAHATGRDDQWYIGFGGTGALLEPDPVQSGNNTDESFGGGGTFFIGKDLDERVSIQFQAFSLGSAVLDDGNDVDYNAADGSVVYRFFDTRDNNLNDSVFGTSFYGRFALGYADRKSDTELEREDDVYFGAGAGFETYLHKNVAVRGEAFFHDIDVVSASLGLVFRFGGSHRAFVGGLGNPGLPSSTTRPGQPTETAPPVIESLVDADGDGVRDEIDSCPSSTLGYPVREDGCALFDGVLGGVRFVDDSTAFTNDSSAQLDFLIDMLVNKHPGARVELHSHTDNGGDIRSQSILTRGRLRTVGTYLLEGGISANRIGLRSFGGSQPAFDNATAEGRAANNRIEIFERPR